jgi:hypothetical protein
MTLALPGAGQRELERALSGELAPRLTPAQRRLAELGHLAALLDARARFAGTPLGPGQHSWRAAPPVDARKVAMPHVKRTLYDRTRPAGSPPAETVAERYGGWHAACRAAYGLQPDGTYFGFGQPRPPPFRGRGSRPSAYTEAEALDGIRRCARALGRRPTSTSYRAWVAERALNARRAGRPRPRLADYNTLRALFGGWPQALAAAAITDADLGVPTDAEPENARAALAALAETAVAVLDDETFARALVDGFADLPVTEAARIACALGGSLDWLAGRTEHPGRAASTSATRLSGDAVRSARRDRRLTDAALRARLGLGLGAWRALLGGRSAPPLALLAQLAGLLDRSCEALLTDRN